MIIPEISNSPITLIFLLLSLVISALLTLQILKTEQLYFDNNHIFKDKEFWRFFTSIFCYGKLEIQVIVNIFICFLSMSRIESMFFSQKPVDFLCFLLFGWLSLWVYSSFKPQLFLGKFFSCYVDYYYGKIHNQKMLFILVLLIITVSKNLEGNIISLVTSHLYFFFKDVLRVRYNFCLFEMPECLNRALSSLLK